MYPLMFSSRMKKQSGNKKQSRRCFTHWRDWEQLLDIGYISKIKSPLLVHRKLQALMKSGEFIGYSRLKRSDFLRL